MSWDQLLAVVRELNDLAKKEESSADGTNSTDTRLNPTCPNDGELLITGPTGEVRCPFDGWPSSDVTE